jgi:UDP-N-acetyl-D-mannosaminuronic acid transferase (WecB/TagA/CpsF family)
MSMNAIGEQGAAPIGEPLARQFINILGISLHPMRFLAAADLLEQWVAERLPRIVCFPGSDMLAASQRNTKLGSALNGADLTATDGMMLVRLCR